METTFFSAGFSYIFSANLEFLVFFFLILNSQKMKVKRKRNQKQAAVKASQCHRKAVNQGVGQVFPPSITSFKIKVNLKYKT